MKKAGIGILVVLLTLYISYLFIVPNLVNLNNYKPMITDEVKKATGLNVTLGDLKLYTTPAFKAGVKVKNVDILYPDSRVLVNVDYADVRLKLLPLLLFNIQVDKVIIDESSMNITLNADGKTDIEAYLEKQFPPQKEESKKNGDAQPEDNSGLPVKISSKLPKVIATKYTLNIYDTKNNNKLSVAGNEFQLSGNLEKNIKISTDGAFKSNDKDVITYNVKVDTFIPKMEATEPAPEAAPVKVDLTPISKIVSYKFKTDINTDLKIRQHKDDVVIDGFCNVEGIEFLLNNQLMKENYIKTNFKNNKIDVASNFTFPNTEKLDFTAIIATGKKPTADINIDTAQLNVKNLFDTAVVLLDIANLKVGAEDFRVNGILKSDLKINTDMKKMAANGALTLSNGSITHKDLPLNISNIVADVKCNNNALDINNSMSINGSKVSVKGTIDAKANADIKVKTDVLPINTLYNAFAPNEYKKLYAVNSGVLVVNVGIKGPLQDIKPDVGVNVKYLNILDKGSKTTISAENISTDLKCDVKAIDGTISASGSSVVIPGMATLKVPGLNAKFDAKDFTLANSTLYFNESPISFSGKVKDYASKMAIDFKADGKIRAADLKAMVPSEFHNFVSAVGSIPVKAAITGNDKSVLIQAQALSDSSNNFTVLDITKLSGKQALVNAEISSDFSNVKLADIALYGLNNKINLSDNFSQNKLGVTEIASIKGDITDIAGKNPKIKGLSVTMPSNLTAEIPGMKNSKMNFSGGLNIGGSLAAPTVSGNITIPKLEIPDLFVMLNEATLNFNNNALNAKCNELNINGSLFNGSADIRSIFDPIIVINNITVTSPIMDVDKLFIFMDKLNKMMPASTPAPGALAVPVKIVKGNGTINTFKMGEIKASNITSDFTLYNDLFTLKNLVASAYEGKMTGVITYNLKTLHADVDVKGQGMNAKPLVTDFAGIKDQVMGTVEFDAKMTLAGADYHQQMQTLKGYANFTVKDGQFGDLGKFENFLTSSNLVSLNLVSSSVNSVINTVAPKNTGQFDYLKGHINFADGYAVLSPVSSAGKSMSLYITGKYNLLTNYAQIDALGNISQEVVSVLGPVADLSVAKLVSKLGSFGKTAGNYLTLYNQAVKPESTKLIPELSSQKASKGFIVVLDGPADSAKIVKSFKWISSTEEMAAGEKSILQGLLDLTGLGGTESTGNTLKDAGKNILQNIINPQASTGTTGSTTTTTTEGAAPTQATTPQSKSAEKAKNVLNVINAVGGAIQQQKQQTTTTTQP